MAQTSDAGELQLLTDSILVQSKASITKQLVTDWDLPEGHLTQEKVVECLQALGDACQTVNNVIGVMHHQQLVERVCTVLAKNAEAILPPNPLNPLVAPPLNEDPIFGGLSVVSL